MDRDVGIRGIIRPPKSPVEIAEDAKADAEAMAAVVKKIGPIERHTSTMNPDDFGNIHALEAAPKPVRDKFGNTAAQKTKIINDHLTRPPKPKSKLYGDLTKEKDLRKFINEETATDNELYAKLKNDPLRYTQVMGHKYDGKAKPKNYPRVTNKDDPLLEAAELKRAEMLVSKANARAVAQLTNLKNWANNSKNKKQNEKTH